MYESQSKDKDADIVTGVVLSTISITILIRWVMEYKENAKNFGKVRQLKLQESSFQRKPGQVLLSCPISNLLRVSPSPFFFL